MAPIIRVLSVKGYLEPLATEKIKYINKLGIEFEGVWETRPENIHVDESIKYVPPNDVDDVEFNKEHNCHSCVLHFFKHHLCMTNDDYCKNLNHNHCESNCTNPDHCEDTCIKSCGCASSGLHIGECISPPCTIEELRPWVASYAPDIVNRSCGLHVHISMKDKIHYNRLMDKAFTDFFLDWFRNWGEDIGLSKDHSFWGRLDGENRYCKKEHRANEQAAQTIKNVNEQGKLIRRCQLNFCHNIPNPDGSFRGTFECRLFPAFKDPAYIMSAIDNLVRCVEEYLSTTENESVYNLKEYKSFYEDNDIVEAIGETA